MVGDSGIYADKPLGTSHEVVLAGGVDKTKNTLEDRIPPLSEIVTSEAVQKNDIDTNKVATDLNTLLEPQSEKPKPRGILVTVQSGFADVKSSTEESPVSEKDLTQSLAFKLWRNITLKLPSILGKPMVQFVVHQKGDVFIEKIPSDMISKLNPKNILKVSDNQLSKLELKDIEAMNKEQREAVASKLPSLNLEVVKKFIAIEPEMTAIAINNMEAKEAKKVFDQLPDLLGPIPTIHPTFTDKLSPSKAIEIRKLQLNETKKHVDNAPADSFATLFSNEEANQEFKVDGAVQKYEDISLLYSFGRDAQNWTITVNGESPKELKEGEIEEQKSGDPANQANKGKEALALIFETSKEAIRGDNKSEMSVDSQAKELTEAIQLLVHQGAANFSNTEALKTYATPLSNMPFINLTNHLPEQEANRGTRADIQIDPESKLVKVKIVVPSLIELHTKEGVESLGFAVQTTSIQIPIHELIAKKSETGTFNSVISTKPSLQSSHIRHNLEVQDSKGEVRDTVFETKPAVTGVKEAKINRKVAKFKELATDFNEDLALDFAQFSLEAPFGERLENAKKDIQEALSSGKSLEDCREIFEDQPLHAILVEQVAASEHSSPEEELEKIVLDQSREIWLHSETPKEDKEQIVQLVRNHIHSDNLTSEAKMMLETAVKKQINDLVSESKDVAKLRTAIENKNQQKVNAFKKRLIDVLDATYQKGETQIPITELNKIKEEFGILTPEQKQIAINRQAAQQAEKNAEALEKLMSNPQISEEQKTRRAKEMVIQPYEDDENVSIEEIFESCLEQLSSSSLGLATEIISSKGIKKTKGQVRVDQEISAVEKSSRVAALKKINQATVINVVDYYFKDTVEMYFPAPFEDPQGAKVYGNALLEEFLNNPYRP